MSERDVERACAEIANALQDNAFRVSDSLVRNLEHKALLPTGKKLYSLCRVYQLSPFEVYSWYGVPFGELNQQRFSDRTERTVLVDFDVNAALPPSSAGPGSSDLPRGFPHGETALIGILGAQWGESLAPFLLIGAEKRFLFAKVGYQELFLYPLVLPGSLLVIDPAHTTLQEHQQGSYWTRPIYFLEFENQYLFGYCEMLSSGRLLLSPHADSPSRAREIEVSEGLKLMGRVISVAIPNINRDFEAR